MRLLIILADIGILFFGKKLLNKLNLPAHNIFWYVLNPLVIIEATGNLHFEPVMLFFLVWSLYELSKGKWFWGAILFALSVSVKLIPLLFLPIFYQLFMKSNAQGFGKIVQSSSKNSPNLFKNLLKLSSFYVVVILTVIITFIPFLSKELINNQSETLSLYFQNFEFNGSVYYIVRWIGYKIVGWNIIQFTAKIFPLIVLFLILMLTFFRKNKTLQDTVTAMLFAIGIYFLFSTTVHPWYTILLLFLSVFTKYRFPLVWSATIILTYSAYGEKYGENFWLITIEYGIVLIFIFTELFSKKIKQKTLNIT